MKGVIVTGSMMRAAGVLAVLACAIAACDKEVILQGTRYPVREPLQDSVPVDGQPEPVPTPDQPENQARGIALPGMIVNADWAQRGGNAVHSGPHGSLSATPQLIWSTNIGAGNSRRNRITAAPVVAGGRIFTLDALSNVTATGTNGATLWHRDVTAPYDSGGGQSGGGLATSGARVFVTTGYGEVVALDASNGAVVWRQRLDSPAAGAPGISGDTVFVASVDGTGWGISASSGKVLWHLAGASENFTMAGGAAPAIDGGRVFFPFSAGLVMAATTDTGGPLWVAAVSGTRLGRAYANVGDITGDPVISGGTVYVGTEGGRTGAYREDTGERLWTANEGALNPPLVAGGSVFVVNDESRLVRLDAGTGEVIWAEQMPYFTTAKVKKQSEISAHYGPVLAGGHLVVASSDGLLRLFNATDGSLAGQVALPGGAATPPALAGGMLFVVNNRGQLLAFR
ncbi:MAG: PQQ-binding-like beta-propeller repeat protein [Paracoccaceae bacterium]